MLILLRAYRDSCYVMDTLLANEVKLTRLDIDLIYNNGGGFYSLTDAGKLQKVQSDLILPELRVEDPMVFLTRETRTGFITLYRHSPSYNGSTQAVYDIFVFDKKAKPECLVSIQSIYLGGSKSSHFLDEAVSHRDEQGVIETRCIIRKHEHVGHKSYDEYHAKWMYKNGSWDKEEWEFIDNCTGW